MGRHVNPCVCLFDGYVEYESQSNVAEDILQTRESRFVEQRLGDGSMQFCNRDLYIPYQRLTVAHDRKTYFRRDEWSCLSYVILLRILKESSHLEMGFRQEGDPGSGHVVVNW